MQRSPREEFKTLKDVFDLFTERSIFKLISQGYFEGLESPISVGKEANIFTALTKSNEHIIIKIYRVATCDFYKMYTYMHSDQRFQNLRKQKREVIFAWAKREYRNLLKARECGVRVPKAIAVLNNILVMELIGSDGPSPKLKDKHPKKPNMFFDEVIKNVKKLYDAGLVHADLSKFNILNRDEKPVFIDLSQTTTLENPNAIAYLKRDIKNVCNFFKKLKVSADEEKIIKEVVGNRVKEVM